MSTGTETRQFARIYRPESAAEVADILRASSATSQVVVPFGGGTALHIGGAIAEGSVGIDLRGISGVEDYQPTDLTAKVWAGTTFSDMRRAFAEYGQELPIDVPFPDRATLGGVMATGYAGPRKLSAGPLKDYVIGSSFVRGDGLIAKAGGMLVKNVSGFEISRFLHGSWGTLAVITSINVKLVPIPRADATIELRSDNLADAVRVQTELLTTVPPTAMMSVGRRDDGYATYIRITGREGAVDDRLERMQQRAGDGTIVENSAGTWQHLIDAHAARTNDVILTVGARPSRMGEWLASLPGALQDGITMSVGTGMARLAFRPEVIDYESLVALLASEPGPWPRRWTIEDAPDAWLKGRNVWSADNATLPVSTSIKREFDPADILNRGRFIFAPELVS